MGEAYLYLSNASAMTPRDVLVCSCTFLMRSDTSFASRNVVMRSLMRAHSSWKGGGVLLTRGSEKPEAVFIASARAALDTTSDVYDYERVSVSTIGRTGCCYMP